MTGQLLLKLRSVNKPRYIITTDDDDDDEDDAQGHDHDDNKNDNEDDDDDDVVKIPTLNAAATLGKSCDVHLHLAWAFELILCQVPA